ncbi:MAG: hypothetical protein HFJ35_04165 [Clostridia bacterium]|nr:hypothetical protein [Clostridia bacterium]
MLKTKARFKLLLALGIMILAICVFNMNTVNAAEVTSQDNKVLIRDEVVNGLTDTIDVLDNNERTYWIELNPLKTIDLILDTQKLNSLIEADNYVYQKVYYKVPDDITKATITYNPYKNTKEQEVNIVTINNTRYAEVKLAIAIKIDGIYSHAGLNCDGVGTLTPNSWGRIKLYKNSEVIENVILDCIPSENIDKFSTNFASIEIISDTKKDYFIGGAGIATVTGNTYNRVLAEGNCYVYAHISTYIGETFELNPFGTLTYKGVSEENGFKTYTYQKEIKDKTIFNKDRIVCAINSKENKILTTNVLYFQGDLIKENVKLNDKETNITLEAKDGVVPKDTILVVNTINNNYYNYQQLANIFHNSKNFKMFDIRLESNGVAIQPNGKVKISVPIPAEFDKSNLVVYRVEENGDKIEYTVTVNGDVATFETDHFSTYVLAEKETTQNTENTNNTTDRKKDDTPKTGTISSIYFMIPVAVISATGIIAFRRKETK